MANGYSASVTSIQPWLELWTWSASAQPSGELSTSQAAEEEWGLESRDIAREVAISLPGPDVETQEITFKIVDSGGEVHLEDQAIPTNFIVRPDLPVRITISNYTAYPHTFHSSSLGIRDIIQAGTRSEPSETSFAFTPGRRGVFYWECLLCLGDTHMRGAVFAILPT